MNDIAFQSAGRLASRIRRRQVGCLELLEHYLARVERFNPALSAIVETCIPAARDRAGAADAVPGTPSVRKGGGPFAKRPARAMVPPLRSDQAASACAISLRLLSMP